MPGGPGALLLSSHFKHFCCSSFIEVWGRHLLLKYSSEWFNFTKNWWGSFWIRVMTLSLMKSCVKYFFMLETHVAMKRNQSELCKQNEVHKVVVDSLSSIESIMYQFCWTKDHVVPHFWGMKVRLMVVDTSVKNTRSEWRVGSLSCRVEEDEKRIEQSSLK